MRLLDAHKLIAELNEEQVEGDELYKGLGKAKLITCYQPTIDAVPVVRCRNCVYCDKHTCYLWGEIGIRVSEDGYCNNGIKGERKTDDNY